MSAIGPLLVLCMYAVLAIAVLAILIKLAVEKDPGATRSLSVACLVVSLLLGLFVFSQYYNHKDAEQDYVGDYVLSHYPDCPSCLLELKSDLTFLVKDGALVKEEGVWRYRSGGDYWIVDLNEHDQLGSSQYRYSTKIK